MSAAGTPQTPALAGDLFGAFAGLREHTPVLHNEELGVWVVTRYEDVLRVVRDHQVFSSEHSDLMHEIPPQLADQFPDGYTVDIPALANADPPVHTRIRKLAQKALAPSAVARHDDKVRALVDALIDEVVEDGGADLIEALALPLPTAVLSAVLGIPDEDRRQFEHWGRGVIELIMPNLTDERRFELAREQVAFRDYVDRIIARRRAAPGDDLISGLILASEADEAALTDREIVGVVTQLMTAGVETTTAGIGISLLMLFAHPEAVERVKAEPALIPTAIEEALRRMAPARGVLRETTIDVEIGGTTIPAGARVFALVASANHDEQRFGCPHAFDISRDPSELRQSLAFGIGTHFCIGAILARLEMRVALELILSRLPNLRLAQDEEIRWSESFIFQGPLSLPLEWDTTA